VSKNEHHEHRSPDGDGLVDGDLSAKTVPSVDGRENRAAGSEPADALSPLVGAAGVEQEVQVCEICDQPIAHRWDVICIPCYNAAYARVPSSADVSPARTADAVQGSDPATEPCSRDKSSSFSWQPIETAPKDGTQLLLARRQLLSGELIAVSGSWNSGGAMHMPHWMTPVMGFQPTHWMPLPSPPASPQTDAGETP